MGRTGPHDDGRVITWGGWAMGTVQSVLLLSLLFGQRGRGNERPGDLLLLPRNRSNEFDHKCRQRKSNLVPKKKPEVHEK